MNRRTLLRGIAGVSTVGTIGTLAGCASLDVGAAIDRIAVLVTNAAGTVVEDVDSETIPPGVSRRFAREDYPADVYEVLVAGSVDGDATWQNGARLDLATCPERTYEVRLTRTDGIPGVESASICES